MCFFSLGSYAEKNVHWLNSNLFTESSTHGHISDDINTLPHYYSLSDFLPRNSVNSKVKRQQKVPDELYFNARTLPHPKKGTTHVTRRRSRNFSLLRFPFFPWSMLGYVFAKPYRPYCTCLFQRYAEHSRRACVTTHSFPYTVTVIFLFLHNVLYQV